MTTLGRDAAFQLALRLGLLSRGQALRRLGRDEEARKALEEALRFAIASSDFIAIAMAASELCLCFLDQERLGEAQRELAELNRQIESINRLAPLPQLAACIAVAEVRLHSLEKNGVDNVLLRQDAERACADLMRWARRHPAGLPAALWLRARFAWLRGHTREAEHLWPRAIAAAEVLGARLELALAHREMGVYLDAAAHRDLAREITSSFQVEAR